MKIVIKIPDKIYKFVQNTSFVENESTLFKQTSAERQKTLLLFDILDAIKNGTPLPKGHGDLIDYGYVMDAIVDWINAEEYKYTNATDYLRKRIANAPTIIEGSESE